MKIKQFNTVDACNTPRKLSLKDPFSGELLRDESGKTVDFWVYGIQSTQFRNANKAKERKYGKDTALSDDDAAKAGAEVLAAVTQGWSNNLEDDNGPLAYSQAAAVALYMAEDWIASQVLSFIRNLANYDPKQ